MRNSDEKNKVFAWRTLTSEGIVIAADIDDAADKLVAMNGEPLFLVSEMNYIHDGCYYSPMAFDMTIDSPVPEAKTKLWKYLIICNCFFMDRNKQYAMTKFVDSIDDEEGEKLLLENI